MNKSQKENLLLEFIDWAKETANEDAFYIFFNEDEAVERFLDYQQTVKTASKN